ncbi:MAG: hypothetical protein NXH97_18495 [Rhodobacteraceae bacterium]|nr:hypothetical protein [Paracoccaceae bacterium]
MTLHLTARTTIPAPLEMCWDRFVDIDAVLERVPHKRVDIVRSVGAGPACVGAAWQVSLHFAGRDHHGQLVVTELTPPQQCRLQGGTDSIKLTLSVDMSAVSEVVTALVVSAEGTPASLSGRLLLKPLQIIRPAIEAKFQDRVAWVVSRMMDDAP